MTLREALQHFDGKKVRLAEALGISKQAINKWPMDEAIPEHRELQLKYEVIPSLESKNDNAA